MIETINWVQQGYATWPIVSASDHPVAKMAAQELATYIQRISDRPVPILSSRDGLETPCIELYHEAEGSDGFVRQIAASGVQIAGRSPRGLLFAIYDLLEDLGCRWYGPGPQGERVPRMINVGVPAGIKDEEPFLPGRCLILHHHTHVQHSDLWLDWAAKNRYTSIFFRLPTEPRAARRYRRAWRRQHKLIGQMAQERGLKLEYGGDILESLIPPWLFWQDRKRFRFDGQHRRNDHLCASNPESMAWLRQRVTRLFQRNPEIDRWHIWPTNQDAAAWCDCPDCRRLSPSDQALLLINAMAEALETVSSAATISFAAQQATLATPLAHLPRPNVALLAWAADRCYAHGIDDVNCESNRLAWQPLPTLANWFAQHTDTPATAAERYLDRMQFDGLTPLFSNLIRADVRGYRQGGYDRIAMQVDPAMPWFGAPLNGYLFAKQSWQPNQAIDALLDDIAQGYFGGPKDELAAYLRERETAGQFMLDQLVRPSPQRPLDMEEPPASRRTKLAAIRQAQQHLAHAQEHLKAASKPGMGYKPRGRVTRQEILQKERLSLAFERAVADYYQKRQLAHCLIGEKASRRQMRIALADARHARRQVKSWIKKNVDKPWHRRLFQIANHWRAQLLRFQRDGLIRIKPLRTLWTWRANRLDPLR